MFCYCTAVGLALAPMVVVKRYAAIIQNKDLDVSHLAVYSINSSKQNLRVVVGNIVEVRDADAKGLRIDIGLIDHSMTSIAEVPPVAPGDELTIVGQQLNLVEDL